MVKKNAFFYFMEDMIRNNPGKYRGMKDCQADAGAAWQKMAPEQKRSFEIYAKQKNEKKNPTKYTLTGESIATVKRREQEKIDEFNEKIDYVKNMICMGVESGTVHTKMFYFAHVNYFCLDDSDNVIPAEIAVLRFNLQDGILPENVFHSFTNAGALPMGMYGKAKRHTDETHKINLPSKETATCDMDQVMGNLESFIESFNEIPENPLILYTLNKDCKIVENFLFNFGLRIAFKVYEMDCLLFNLRNGISKERFDTSSISTLTLEKDPYEYTTGIACKYHEEADIPQSCSRSYVIRHAYIFCDTCCRYVDIKLIPGRHVPIDSEVQKPQLQNDEGFDAACSLLTIPDDSSEACYSVQNSTYTEDSHLSDFLPKNFLRKPYDISSELSTLSLGDIPSLNSSEQTGGLSGDEEWIKPKHRGRSKMSTSSSTFSGVSSVSLSRRPNSNSLAVSFAELGNKIEHSRGRGRGFVRN